MDKFLNKRGKSKTKQNNSVQSKKPLNRKELRKQAKKTKKEQKFQYAQQRAAKKHGIQPQQAQSQTVEPQTKVKKQVQQQPSLGKRSRQQEERPSFKQPDDENAMEIAKLDDEIKLLERKLGLNNDLKRKARNDKQTDLEGFGLGFMQFLDSIETKAKMKKEDYKQQDYKFNNPEYEVALGESDFESDQEFESGSNQEVDQDMDLSEDASDMESAEAEMGSAEDELEEQSYGEEGEEESQEAQEEEFEEDMEEEEAEEEINDDLSSIEDDLNPDEQESSSDEEQSDSELSVLEKVVSQTNVKEQPETPQATQAWQPKFKQRLAQSDSSASQSGIQEAEKQLRSVLNRVSEGNIDPMFNQLSETVQKWVAGGKSKKEEVFQAYSNIFHLLAVSQQQQMNQLLSVNCVFVAALHRLHGMAFIAQVLKQLCASLLSHHDKLTELEQKNTSDLGELAEHRTKLKNILNCLIHFYLFQSISSDFLFSVIHHLLASFTESDIEVLIFVLHNIGLQLRKQDPEAIKGILDSFTQKKNSHQAMVKMEGGQDSPQFEQKLKFLVLELQDIKNNKGNVTLQVRSIEHLQTWLRRDQRLANELTIQPLEVTLNDVKEAIANKTENWWKLGKEEMDEQGEEKLKVIDFKAESKASSAIADLAKKHHMVTDIKKAVFQAIVGSEDYLEAFEKLNTLNLKKTQQREIVRVLLHCCLNEKTYNKYYTLLAQRFIRFDPQNFKYTFKYALWDYLKTLEQLEIPKIVNLSQMCAELFISGDLPLHFLKVIEFDQIAMNKPMLLFLQLTFEQLLTTENEQLQLIFARSFKDTQQKKQAFIKGLSQFILGRFYSRLKKKHGEIPKDLSRKLKSVFKVVNEAQNQ